MLLLLLLLLLQLVMDKASPKGCDISTWKFYLEVATAHLIMLISFGVKPIPWPLR